MEENLKNKKIKKEEIENTNYNEEAKEFLENLNLEEKPELDSKLEVSVSSDIDGLDEILARLNITKDKKKK